MDVAALSITVDSSEVVRAAKDLDRFSAASAKAGNAARGPSSGAAAMAQDLAKSAASAQAAASQVGNFSNAASRAAAAAQSAGRALQQADSHVEAYRQHLAAIPAAAGQAAAGVNKLTQAANDNAGALQSNTSNIAAQFQDIGVTAAMGMNPLIIGLQQGTQLSAVFAQSGGTMRDVLVGAFKQIASAQALLTIGMVALVAVAIQLAMAWYNSESEAEKLAKRIESIKTASDGVSDAQGILGRVFDLTTGKMKTQTAAAVNLARAQLLLMKATAQSNISKAAKDLDGSSELGFGGRLSAWLSGDRGLIEGSARVEALTKALKNNQITGAQAMQGLQMLADNGQITNEMFLKGSAAAANYGAEIENVKTATQALADLDRGKLSDIFINERAPRKPRKGPKTDAEKLAEVYASANADIAAERTRGLSEANSATAFEAARAEKATALLNAIQQKGIPITDAVRKKVAELADEYAKLKIAADVSGAINAANADIEQQRAAVADQVKLVGLYGDALARATREQEAQRRLRESLPKGEIVVAANLTGGLSDDIEDAGRLSRAEKLRKDAEDSAYAMNLERQGLTLTGEAAIRYAFVVDRLNEAKRAGIALSPAEVAGIEAAGTAYANQRYAIDQQAQSIADARDVTKGFFSDWINGAREGGNALKAFADASVNALNRIIDKLLDKALDTFLSSAFPSGGSGLFGGGKAPVSVPKSVFPNALGGVYGSPQRFANGGAFTNSIVTSPTLFRFANGAALGEMGEAGPEAIMPLKRGPNGALGVEMHGGGRPVIRMGDYNPTFSFAGAVGLDGIASLIRQGGEATYDQIKRDFGSIAAQYDNDGAFAS